MTAFVASAAAVLLMDQASKRLVGRYASKGRAVAFLEIRAITHVGRTPASRSGRWRLLGLWLAALAGLALQVRYGPQFRGTLAQLALGAASGGAAGNLLDHLRRGGVVDFVRIGWWPVFNLADVGISCGALAALWWML